MKTASLPLILVGLLIFLNLKAQTEMDSVSYSMGVLVASNLKQQGLKEIDSKSFADAVNDVLGDQELKIDLQTASMVVQKHMKKAASEAGSATRDAGRKFLEENAKKEGVVTLDSGLQYEFITEGTGPKPTKEDKVSVHYHGALIDGKVFDSSVERGQPMEFGVTQVIPGWVEALQLMPVGSKWRLFIPFELAYGDRGAGAMIKPFSTLIFEVELLEIK